MIPYQAALFAWIPLAALIMLDRNSARGFTIAMLAGLLLLPEAREFELPGVPDISKANVTIIGVLLGTILFHPGKFDRFRFTWSDLFIVCAVQCTIITAYWNYDLRTTLSDSFSFALNFAALVVLARIHLGTLSGVRTFLLGVVVASVVMAPLALWEWRMSPQLHTTTYGYFQHVFQQHARGSFFRPILFFSHALALGRFFAFAAFLALLPMRRDLVQWLGPVGRLVFVAPLGGLVLSMSWGPMLLFLLLCAGYFVVERMPRLSLALPATALTLILIHFAGTPIFVIAQNAIAQVAPDRAASLQYRVDALDEYSSVILARPCFGFGTQGDGRIQGRATDSQALISLLRAGFIGTFFYFGWYVLALWSAIGVAERTRGTVFFRRALGACLVGGLGLAVTVIDAGLDLWMILTLAPMVSLYAWLKDQPPRLAPAPPRFVPARSIS